MRGDGRVVKHQQAKRDEVETQFKRENMFWESAWQRNQVDSKNILRFSLGFEVLHGITFFSQRSELRDACLT